MIEPVIAVVFDFDGTLGPDTISFFLQEQGINVEKFWDGVNEMVKNDWDPPHDFMHKMLELAKVDKLDISKKALARSGEKMSLFPGLPNALKELKDYGRANKELKDARI